MDLPEGFHNEVIEARENSREKVSTYLLNRGGPSFETHILHKSRNNILRFKLSPRLGFETIILFGIPLAFIVFLFYKFNTTGSFKFLLNKSSLYFVAGYFCMTFLASLLGNLKYYTFSKVVNYYYKGFPLFPYQLAYEKCELNDILAIQVLGEELIEEKSKARLNSFELNLVLKNLKRVHVVDHNNLQGMLDDVDILSKYLNVPIWHAKTSENK